MANRLVSFAPQVKRATKEGMRNFLQVAGIMVADEAKRIVSTPGSGRKRGRKAGPIERSGPGEPPRKQTGILRASIFWALTKGGDSVRIGTSLLYGVFLELGTRLMAARPWLSVAFERMRADLAEKAKQIIGARLR